MIHPPSLTYPRLVHGGCRDPHLVGVRYYGAMHSILGSSVICRVPYVRLIKYLAEILLRIVTLPRVLTFSQFTAVLSSPAGASPFHTEALV